MNSLVNGCPNERLPADDRGFLFGESVFETIAFRHGEAPLWPLHMERLARGADWLHIETPSCELLLDECRRLLPPQGRFIVRITLSAGSGGSGYWPALEPRACRVVQRRDWPEKIELQRQSGLHLCRSSLTLPSDSLGSGLKHGNRLLQVRAARDCARSGHDEALLLDGQNCMVEAISSSFLVVLQGRLLSHPAPAVAGVGLEWLRRSEDLDIVAEAVPFQNLALCSEALVINSVAGVRPVIAIDEHRLPIGPYCRHLQALWNSQLI